jgi:hypothetical protein
MSYEELGSGPDIDNLDISSLDLGNEIEKTPAVAEPEPSTEQLEQEIAEANPEKTAPAKEEPAKEEPAKEEQPRDENGRFAEKEVRIPKSRFDEAVNKEREAREAAERRAQELERRLQEAAGKKQDEEVQRIEGEVEALEVQYQELLLDGKTAEAAKVMKQIRLAERQIATAEAENRARATTAQAIEADRLEAAIARMESDHPEFNPESENYDEDLVSLVLAKQRTLVQGGMSPSQALTKAGKEVSERFLVKQKEAPKEEDAKGLAAAAKQVDRQKEAVTKAIEAQKAQPASTKEVGVDSDKLGAKELPDVTKLTVDEFDALPEATKARLMGNLS